MTDKVTNVPKHKVVLKMNYTIPVIECRFDMNMTHLSESYGELPTAQNPNTEIVLNDSYTIFNSKISRRFFNKYEGYIRGENIFDKNYEYQSGYPAPGRSVWMGVSYTY